MTTQAERIKSLLVERLQSYDSSLDTSEGSGLYSQVVQPIVDAMGVDFLDTDSLEFLLTRLRQEFPSIPADIADAIVDQLIKPLSLLTEALKRELETVKRGQSARNKESLTLEQATDLSANWFVSPRGGGRAQTTVRVFYAAPRNVSITSTLLFQTSGGLNFLPLRAQFIRLETVLSQRQGLEYYVDVPVIAEKVGSEYTVDAGGITRATGLDGASRITNLFAASPGFDAETSEELLDRTEASLVTRTLNVKRGIQARLFEDFVDLRNLEVVGAGDPEMERDLLTGGGEGDVVAAGICILVGQYCLMVSQFESRGVTGLRKAEVGDEIELNYWDFLYAGLVPTERNEDFVIHDILFDTRGSITNLPSILLMRLSGGPTVPSPVDATIPGTHPGVFAVIRGPGTVEISDIPGGILEPNSVRGTVIVDADQVHLYGHYDVWARPTTDTSAEAQIELHTSASLREGSTLSTAVVAEGGPNAVHLLLQLEISSVSGSFILGEVVRVAGTGAGGTIVEIDGAVLTLSGRTPFNNVLVSHIIVGETSLASGTVDVINEETLVEFGFRPYDVPVGLTLEILKGPDAGSYKVMKVVDDRILILDAPMTQTNVGLDYRLISRIEADLFSPEQQFLPFVGKVSSDLKTTIGTGLVRITENLRVLGVIEGDQLEILEGPDAGVHTIESFDAVYGGLGPVLGTIMSSTNSGLPYRVYRPSQGVQAPLVRIPPGGVRLLDASGQDSGTTVPYALPVSGRAPAGFSGARTNAAGLNGFVLPDPGLPWEPTADVTAAASLFADAKTCFSDECVPCDGYIAVATLLNDGSFYVDSGLPVAAIAFLSDIKTWFLDIIDTFGIGADAEAFVTGLTPIIWDTPPGAGVVKAQFEICLPREAFDGCNNTFVALPDVQWDAEFAKVATFQEALDNFINGELDGGHVPPALWGAVPGDTLTVPAGANAGSYVISGVHQYRIGTLGSIVGGVYEEDEAYPVALVNIKGEFPVLPLAGLVDFFAAGIPTLTVPAMPSFGVDMYDSTTGALVTPWTAVEEILTFLFQWFDAAGFDAPDSLSLDPGNTLTTLWQLLFVDYTVGVPACLQDIRAAFVEPTAMTVYAPRECAPYKTGTAFGDGPLISGSAAVSLPQAGLGGGSWEVTVRDLFGVTTYSGTLPASAGTEAVPATLAGIITTAIQDEGLVHHVVVASGSNFNFTTVVAGVEGDAPFGLDYHVALKADDPADAFALLGFVTSTAETGTSPIPTTTSLVARMRPPTRFVGAVGAERIEFTVDPSVELLVYPPADTDGELPVTEFLRDLLVSEQDPASELTALWSNDNLFETAVFRELIPGADSVRLYAHRKFLAVVVPEGPAFAAPDRVVGVITSAGSPVVRLPSVSAPQFTFLAPASGLDRDEVKVGDLLFIEEGDDSGGYVVTSRTAAELVLDRPLSLSTAPILSAGVTGIIDVATDDEAIVVPALPTSLITGPSLSDYIGDYVTIWATSRPEYDGAYAIASIDDLGATWRLHLTIDTPFPFDEADVHWAVAAAPDPTPGTSGTGGQTALSAVRPVRVYNGVPEEHVVASHTLKSAFPSYVVVSHAAATEVSRGVKQPYAFVRKGVKRIAASEMLTQGRALGLYWFDIPAISLGHTTTHNVEKDFRLEPLFGTYDSDGYWLDVRDRNLVFSGKEDTALVLSGSIAPTTAGAALTSKISLHGRKISISYEYSPLVDRIQALLVSDSDRIVTASPLARHFLPSYVYLDIVFEGGNSREKVAGEVSQYLNGLNPTDALDLSQVEKILQRNNVSRYDHPITLMVVTHDLDRRLVESRSQNRLDDASEDFEGSNRLTFFIPGRIATETEESNIPDGERIFLTRTSGTGAI